MKRYIGFVLALLFVTTSVSAVRLYNKDSESHPIIIKCSSTTHAEIGSNASRDLGTGPCTVTLKSTGQSATASGSKDIIIEKGGKITTN